MLNMKISWNELKPYAIIALAYLLISLVLFWPVTTHITSTVPGAGGDTFQSMWELWWVPYSLFTLHSTPYFSHYIFYPLGANLATQTMAPIAGLLSVFFQPVGVAFAFNIIFLLGFVLSGLFTYMLAFHVTKHRAASFIAGFIYAFSPIHTIQAFGHLQFTNIEFIPLFLLLFLKMMEEKKQAYTLGAAVSFVLIAFMGDIEQALMTIMIMLFVLLYFFLAKDHRHKVVDRKFQYLFAEMLIAAFVLSSPFVFSILSLLNPATLASVNAQAGTVYNELYSPDLLSFFVPSLLNGPLSPLSSGFVSIIAPAASERTTYIGYSVLLLVLVSFGYEYREKFKHTGVFLGLLVLFLLLSIGPYLQINGHLTPVPGIYQLYHQIPLFNVLREPGRFDIPLELFLALFAAIGFTKLETKLNLGETKRYLPAVFIVLLMIEYNAWPTSTQMLRGMYTLNTTIPSVYYRMGSLTSNFSVLMLPAIPNYSSPSPALYPGRALYYQTAFKHPLVGGYATRTNVSESLVLVNVPLLVSAYYLQNGQGLVYGSPVHKSYAGDTFYTNVTTFFLAAYNVGFVSVFRNAYNYSNLQQLISYLASFMGAPPYISNDSLVFPTTNITSYAGNTLIEYTPVLFNSPLSLWQPGWLLCGSNTQCSSDYLNAFFGINPSYINIYSPNATKLSISFRALAPFGFNRVTAYFNNLPVLSMNLTPTFQNYTIRVALVPQRINSLYFRSTSNGSQGSYTNIGIANMTFKKFS